MSLQDSDVVVGLRIIGNGIQDGVDITGFSGVVVGSCSDRTHAIQFDVSRPSFHTCFGMVKDGHGYWVHTQNLAFEEVQYVPTQEGDKEDDI